MRKLGLTLVIFLVAMGLFAQTAIQKQRMTEIEEYFKLFEIEVAVWLDPAKSSMYFEDIVSRTFDDMLFQWGYMMQALDFMLVDRGLKFEDLKVNTMQYVWIVNQSVEQNVRTLSAQKYEIEMTQAWLQKYFAASRKDRSNLIQELFAQNRTRWESSRKLKY